MTDEQRKRDVTRSALEAIANAIDDASKMIGEGKAIDVETVLATAEGTVREKHPEAFDTGPVGTPIGEATKRTLARIADRKAGRFGAVATPFATLNGILGGGFEPGIHVLVGGTGAGKSTLAVQCALHAARAGHAVGYVSLELELEQITARMMAEVHNGNVGMGERRVFFSEVIRGESSIDLDACATKLDALPIVIDAYSPLGWQATKLRKIAEHARPLGAEGKTPFVVLDYLQLVGEEEDTQRPDVRARIGKAAAVAHGIATDLRAAVLVVSSVARSHYGTLAGGPKSLKDAGIAFVCERNESSDEARAQAENGYRFYGEDGLVGLGKESGEIEYSASSVLAMVKGGPINGGTQEKPRYGGQRIALAIAKSRYGQTAWCPLRFSFGSLADGNASDAAACVKNFEAIREQTKPSENIDTRADREKAKKTERSQAAIDAAGGALDD